MRPLRAQERLFQNSFPLPLKQHKQLNTNTDTTYENGQIVPSVPFDFDAIDGLPAANPHDDRAQIRIEALRNLLGFLTSGADATACGQRVHLIAYMIKQSECRTQRELAKRLGLTPGRISQALNEVRRELSMIAGLKCVPSLKY